MSRTAYAFLLILVMAGALCALSIALDQKGYDFGALGVGRLDGLADAATFVPLAAIYAFSAVLMLILPLRAAGFVHAHGAVPVYSATLVLFATIVGVQAARFGFGDRDALWRLVDWQFVFAAAIVAAHLLMSDLRRDLLLRSVSLAAFAAATLACLYWTFRL